MIALGPLTVDPPVVLAPMAGITNTAFRRLCKSYGGGLYVSEMITSRALVERNPKTMRLIHFEPDESPRSIQLYGVDPVVVGQAAAMIRDEDLADHIDLNFGCPVPKVTRKGGGAALPWRIDLFAAIVGAAVENAGHLPVTVKMRIGIDAEHHTYREAGLRAQDAGVKWVALHARTAEEYYGGQARWGAIADLVGLLDVPVLGNGDIWEASDALRMVRETGCAGVVVGRGCLGRPWLFGDLEAAFCGQADIAKPNLRHVAEAMRRHAGLLVEWMDADRGVIEFRKHVAWYLKGFSVGSELRQSLATSSTLAELDDLLGKLDLDQPFPEHILGQPRGRTTGGRGVSLPAGWLDDRHAVAVPAGAELDDSGG